MQVQTSGNSKTYNIEEHKHRFAVCAASRGASTRRAAFSVAEGKTILEAIGLNRNLDRFAITGPDGRRTQAVAPEGTIFGRERSIFAHSRAHSLRLSADSKCLRRLHFKSLTRTAHTQTQYLYKRMARPVRKWLPRDDPSSLHQRIRSRGSSPAKMEIRASWS